MITAATMIALGGITAPSASAAGSDSLSFGESATASFGANAVVRIDGRLTYLTLCHEPTGITDFVYPATDVFVVKAVPLGGEKLVDAGGGPPNTIISSQSIFIDEIIAITAPTGSLGDGTYSVVYDTCQDGKFNPAEDTVFADAISVKIPFRGPGASMALVDLKGAAEEEAYSWARAHALFQTIEKIAGIPDLIGCMMSPDPDCLTFILLGEATGGFAFTASVSDQFKKLMLSQGKHYAAIAADPPDPDFRKVTAIDAVPSAAPGDGQALPDAMSDSITPLAGEGALAQALLHAVERYQGAQVGGDAQWSLVHARQVADLAAALSQQAGATAGALEQLRAAVQTAPGDVDAAFAAARSYIDRVETSGYTPDERRQLANLGLSPAQIAERETQTRRAYGLIPVTRASIVAQLDELIAAHAATRTALASTRTAFGGIATQIEGMPGVSDLAPIAAAGGPYTATQGGSLTVDGSGSTTPSGTLLTTYEWDLDSDGAFDDATGASPSVTAPGAGARLIGLRVTNSADLQSVSYAAVGVADAGSSPTLSNATPATGRVVTKVGAAVDFVVTGADADGDAIDYSWSLDGAAVPVDGSSFSYLPVAADVGVHAIEASASDGTGSAVVKQRWDVTVVDVDGDADGWTKTSDCNDTDGAVSPGAFELLGNGVNDDCDAGTPDAPPGGLTGTPWSWGSNHLGQAGTGSTADYVVPPAPLTAYNDIVQVESGFRTGFAVRADGRVLAWGSNFYGYLGDGTSSHRSTPVPVVGVGGASPELSGVTEVSTSSNNHAAALRSDGTVVAWGVNENRQLGDGSTVHHKEYPVQVLSDTGEPLTGTRSIEGGRYSTYATMNDGTVRIWGLSHCSGGTGHKSVPTATTLTSLGTDVRQISSGGDWTMFRMADGTLKSCGAQRNAMAREQTDTTPYFAPHPMNGFGPGSGVIDISAGSESGVALKEDGSVWVWGWNANGSLTAAGVAGGAVTLTPLRVPLPPGPPVVDVESDEACHTQALRADGSVLIWGCDTHGSTGIVGGGTVTTPTKLTLPASGISSSASVWNGLVLARPLNDTAWERPAFWVDASIADGSAAEAADGGFDVTLSEKLASDVVVSWSVESGTATADDVQLASGTTTVPAGSFSARIPAPVVDDALHEDDETYTVTITDVSHGIGVARSQATGTIEDDDAAPVVSVGPVTVDEGSTTTTDAVVNVGLSKVSALPVTVELTTADGSASAPQDYAAASLLVTIPAGSTSAAAHLVVVGDGVVEPNESFAVHLATPVGATLGQSSAEVTIVDDEALALVVTSPTVDEGTGGTTPAHFEVSLDPPAPAGTSVSVPWSIAAGTAGVPDDVVSASGTLEFASGDGPKMVTVSVQGDGDPEPDESFRLVLGEPVASGGRLVLPADAPLAMVVNDDLADVAPVVDAGSDVSGSEGASVAVVASVTDPDSTPTIGWSAQAGSDVDAGATCTFSEQAASTSVRCTDDGTYVLTLTADDGVNDPVSDTTVLQVSNAAPVIDDLVVTVAGDGTRTVSVSYTDRGEDDHTCTFTWGDRTQDTVVPSAVSPCSAEHDYVGGTHEMSVEVTDDDAGSDSTSRSLLVYAFDGFFTPVDNPPVINVVTAGQAIPVAFSLSGYQGMDIFASGFPSSRQVPCPSGTSSDVPTDTPGTSELTYSSGNDRYQYVWQTSRSWASSCRELLVRFKDGREESALFRFR